MMAKAEGKSRELERCMISGKARKGCELADVERSRTVRANFDIVPDEEVGVRCEMNKTGLVVERASQRSRVEI